MMKQRKVPIRKCISCGEKGEKKALLRLVRTENKEVLLDLTGKQNGRGAYICRDKSCFEKALKNNAIERALNVELSKERKEKLMEAFVAYEQ